MPTIVTKDFVLKSGAVLPELKIAYQTYGHPDAQFSNAILVLHGTTSTHIAAGEVTPDLRKGWWDGVIGPGEVFDTRRYWVISSNMLGSSYGTTGPGEINPETGRVWGPDFPRITVEDMVRAQKVLTDALGIKQLFAVAGQSVGGLLAFQWAVSYPDAMRGVVAHDCGPVTRFGTSAALPELVAELEADPNWNGGHYAEAGGLEDAMTRIRVRMLKSYQFEDKLRGQMPESRIRALLHDTAAEWAHEFDPMSLVRLNEAIGDFDVRDKLDRIKARLFYVLCDTDEFYPADVGAEYVADLHRAGVDVMFHKVHSNMGHYSNSAEPEKWVPEAQAFLSCL